MSGVLSEKSVSDGGDSGGGVGGGVGGGGGGGGVSGSGGSSSRNCGDDSGNGRGKRRGSDSRSSSRGSGGNVGGGGCLQGVTSGGVEKPPSSRGVISFVQPYGGIRKFAEESAHESGWCDNCVNFETAEERRDERRKISERSANQYKDAFLAENLMPGRRQPKSHNINSTKSQVKKRVHDELMELEMKAAQFVFAKLKGMRRDVQRFHQMQALGAANPLLTYGEVASQVTENQEERAKKEESPSNAKQWTAETAVVATQSNSASDIKRLAGEDAGGRDLLKHRLLEKTAKEDNEDIKAKNCYSLKSGMKDNNESIDPTASNQWNTDLAILAPDPDINTSGKICAQNESPAQQPHHSPEVPVFTRSIHSLSAIQKEGRDNADGENKNVVSMAHGIHARLEPTPPAVSGISNSTVAASHLDTTTPPLVFFHADDELFGPGGPALSHLLPSSIDWQNTQDINGEDTSGEP